MQVESGSQLQTKWVHVCLSAWLGDWWEHAETINMRCWSTMLDYREQWLPPHNPWVVNQHKLKWKEQISMEFLVHGAHRTDCNTLHFPTHPHLVLLLQVVDDSGETLCESNGNKPSKYGLWQQILVGLWPYSHTLMLIHKGGCCNPTAALGGKVQEKRI